MPPAIMAYPELRNPYDKVDLGEGGNVVVLYNNAATELSQVLDAPGLWVTPDDLTRINGFVLKPEGACLDDLCVPVAGNNDLVQHVEGDTWFCLSAFAELMEQAYVVDDAAHVYSFGDFPARRHAMLNDAQAPDFEIADRAGNVIRLADLKGKKALIITWSSW